MSSLWGRSHASDIANSTRLLVELLLYFGHHLTNDGFNLLGGVISRYFDRSGAINHGRSGWRGSFISQTFYIKQMPGGDIVAADGAADTA